MLKNSMFCPHTVFMCFVYISEQTAIFFPPIHHFIFHIQHWFALPRRNVFTARCELNPILIPYVRAPYIIIDLYDQLYMYRNLHTPDGRTSPTCFDTQWMPSTGSTLSSVPAFYSSLSAHIPHYQDSTHAGVFRWSLTSSDDCRSSQNLCCGHFCVLAETFNAFASVRSCFYPLTLQWTILKPLR